jgi:alanyl-tRNA synthetase
VIGNQRVQKNEMGLAQARDQGALAFFAEKYEESVRVVSIESISKELCGGTHLDFTGSIGLFKILHEGSVASGVRRIEAVTGKVAFKAVKEEEDVLLSASEALKTSPDKLALELDKRLKQIKELEKKLNEQRFNNVKNSIGDILKKGTEIKGVKVIAQRIDDADMELLRKTADLIKQKEPRVVLALGSSDSEKVFLITATNVKDFDSAALIKEIAPEIGGSGGGRKDFAQAGGNKPENLDNAFAKFKQIISQ